MTLFDATDGKTDRGLAPSVYGPPLESIVQRASILADRLPNLDVARAHGFHLLAIDSKLRRGASLSDEETLDWQSATARTVVVPLVLQRLAAAVTGPVLIVKGAELATRYPSPASRAYSDIDILVENAQTAIVELERSGFTRTGPSDSNVPYHTSVQLPGIPIPVEVHSMLNWPRWSRPPANADLFATAIPSRVDPDRIITLRPDIHAIYVAAHAWTHCPFGQFSDLLDVAVAGAESEPRLVESTAASFGLRRLWQLTIEGGRAVFADDPPRHWEVRRWLPNVSDTRPITRRTYVRRQVLSGVAADTLPASARALGAQAVRHLAPVGGESVAAKARRVLGRVANSDMSAREFQQERARQSTRTASDENLGPNR